MTTSSKVDYGKLTTSMKQLYLDLTTTKPEVLLDMSKPAIGFVSKEWFDSFKYSADIVSAVRTVVGALELILRVL